MESSIGNGATFNIVVPDAKEDAKQKPVETLVQPQDGENNKPRGLRLLWP